ncbi:hypothetical protein PRK78_004367 [Emydomyces testavorans]|uniref:Tyrosine specific protein phosphatases domain-containing protein n=1 Tax=Emydomyces testavorans TaxID=2070801 RepID=A0AAF0DHP3_9EURO|nr:hypothetical protein PRK78_004367 [Emydomyces testavorans]
MKQVWDKGFSDGAAYLPLLSWILLFALGVLSPLIVYQMSHKRPIKNRNNITRNSTAKGAKNSDEPRESSSEEETSEDDGRGPTPFINLVRNGDSDSDPGLLKKHSSFLSYATPATTYPSIRTFFCPHPHIEKLPTKPSPLPLLVFVHGLGGSLVQFHPLLTTLTNVAPCFGIDFPGCGLSDYSPKSWSAYAVEALATLLATAIEQHRDVVRNQQIILVGHSLGASITALIASSQSLIAPELKKYIIGVVSLCPQATPPSQASAAHFRRLLYIPEPIFNTWRRWDRRGGPYSPSVSRFVGKGADIETRMLQIRFNEQSRTPVWRRMAWGTLPVYNVSGEPKGGIPGQAVWKGIRAPLLLIAGESDPITKPTEVSKILEYFGIDPNGYKSDSAEMEIGIQSKQRPSSNLSTNDVPEPSPSTDPHVPLVSHDECCSEKVMVKAFVFPAPASHALPYDRATYRALSGLIQDFLSNHVDQRLSIGWQLQHLTTSGKWDVKNLTKWKAVAPVSEPIGSTFFALKTLRELDEEHSPIPFVQKWKGKIYAIIDISHESPVYDPTQLDKGGIQYHKLPTVSKIPPTVDEVRDFVSLVDRLEGEIFVHFPNQDGTDGARPLIGVHCHYGFNRTGFFITSYLIERKGYTIDEALEEFKRRRPPGIRHPHFIDTLFVRYCTGLRGEAPLEL